MAPPAVLIPTLSGTENEPSRAAVKPKRLIELDVLRGFLLLWMTLTHLPTKVSEYSNQMIGVVSAAEGFIFLAGFMVGQIERRAQNKGGEMHTIRDLARRSTRIYLYHCGMLAIAFTIVAAFGIDFHRLALTNLLSFYMQHPGHAIISAALLIYRPSLFDILPMYIIFMLVTPICRHLANRFGWSLVLGISASVWLAAQFGFRVWFYDNVHILRLATPRDSTGAFDMWGWQLLWVAGLALGTYVADSQTKIVVPRWAVILASSTAVFFLFVRHSFLDTVLNSAQYGWSVDKWHLGILRIVDFAAIIVVLIRFGSYVGKLQPLQPLAALGQTSLEVFCVHVLCCLIAVSLNSDADPMLDKGQQIVVLLATLAALFGTPKVRNLWKQRPASAVSAAA